MSPGDLVIGRLERLGQAVYFAALATLALPSALRRPGQVLGQLFGVLVAPRRLACRIALPVLTLFIMYLALGAGYLAEALGGSMTFRQYANECLRVLRLRDVIPATLKTVVFGYLVGLVGCWQGMNAQ